MELMKVIWLDCRLLALALMKLEFSFLAVVMVMQL
jgi:hypothetical protein